MEWNIGVHMIVYRCGQDKMGWHADNTKGERLILSVVIQCDVVGKTNDVSPRPV